MDWMAVIAVALGLTGALIPLFAGLSERIGLLDLPNDRKIHDRPIPVVGGLAIYCGVVAALLMGGFLADRQVKLLLGASLLVLFLGALDDRLDLRSSHRLAAQVVIAIGLCAAGVHFRLFGVEALDWALTIVWIVGAINALNCIDCADGIAGSTALVAFLYFALAAHGFGRYFIAQVGVAGAAAVVAFLAYNRPKARVFLGDTGSTFLGLALASLSILAAPKAPPPPYIPWPALALFVPVYDILLVHVRRYRSGLRSIRHLLASTGKDHLPHRLYDRGFSPAGAMGVVAFLTGVACAAAWLFQHREWAAGAATLGGLIALLCALERLPERRRVPATSLDGRATGAPRAGETARASSPRVGGAASEQAGLAPPP